MVSATDLAPRFAAAASEQILDPIDEQKKPLHRLHLHVFY
jgi:hypothetical protein